MILSVFLKFDVVSILLLEMACEYLQHFNFVLRKIILDSVPFPY